jgi:seryl-tRNA synthetase
LQSNQEQEAKKLMESTDEIKKRLAAKEVEAQKASQEHPRCQDHD